MIYVIGFCGQVCSAFTVKVNMRFDNLNGEKLPIKIGSIWSCKSIFILISVLQIFDFQCIERFLTTKINSLYIARRGKFVVLLTDASVIRSICVLLN